MMAGERPGFRGALLPTDVPACQWAMIVRVAQVDLEDRIDRRPPVPAFCHVSPSPEAPITCSRAARDNGEENPTHTDTTFLMSADARPPGTVVGR